MNAGSVLMHDTTHVIEELRTSVPLDIMGVEVSPTQLDVDPELVAGRAVKDVLALGIVRYVSTNSND